MEATMPVLYNQIKEAAVDGFLKSTEAAARLGVSPRTIVRWVKDGLFPGSMKMNPYSKNSHYLIPVEAIEQFEEKRKTPPDEE